MKINATYYAAGQWAALCQRCGFEYKSSEIVREEKTRLLVCRRCVDPWHPQEFVRGVPDRQTPPWTSPEPDDDFLSTNEVTVESL